MDSDQEGLEDFLEYDMDINIKQAKFLNSSRADCKVAQIVVDNDQADYCMAARNNMSSMAEENGLHAAV